MSLALFPPILNTVTGPTWSALGKAVRKSTKDVKFLDFIDLYQCWSADLASGCLPANSLSLFRVMMCMESFLLLHPCQYHYTLESVLLVKVHRYNDTRLRGKSSREVTVPAC